MAEDKGLDPQLADALLGELASDEAFRASFLVDWWQATAALAQRRGLPGPPPHLRACAQPTAIADAAALLASRTKLAQALSQNSALTIKLLDNTSSSWKG